jgi:hypothetical protein
MFSPLISNIKARILEIQLSLTATPRHDYPAYMQAVGQVQGLSDALAEIDNLLKEKDVDPDDDRPARRKLPPRA